MKTKKVVSVLLSMLMVISSFGFAVSANAADEAVKPSFMPEEPYALFAHSGSNAEDTEAWLSWQYPMSEEGYVTEYVKHFFLPSGTADDKVEIFNGYNTAAKINGVTIAPKTSAQVNYEIGTTYNVQVNNKTYKAKFMKSTAEAAIFINNPDADGNGTELYSYLTANEKSVSAKGTGAIVDRDGSVDNTSIKKIKGRGNTTWWKAKKPFNVTYNSNVKIGGIGGGKKYSLLANYQDGSLMRNRFLYDLADAVGVPYASDSSFVDFYIDGVYYGSYQCTQKIEVGSKDVVNDIDDEAYIAAEGGKKGDFPFLMEIDPSYDKNSDYHTSAASNDITIKAPEIDPGADYYDQVKSYVADKFKALASAITTNATEAQLSQVMDVESFAKLFLINELGKNWDSGVSSMYMVYKQGADGKYKFFASPVWDYDNSLGNAVGVKMELVSIGVTDYTEPSGWWCKYKGKSNRAKSSSNIMNKVANCTAIQKKAAQVWFDDFMPAINTFSSSSSGNSEILTSAEYYSILSGTAEMNYTRGWLLNTGDWICDHTRLNAANYNFDDDTYTQLGLKEYKENFEGEFNYTVDWIKSRAAWLSKEFRADYTGDYSDNGGYGVAIPAKAATYFEKGFSGDVVCSKCGAIAQKGKETPVKKLAVPKVTIKGAKKKISVKYTKVKGAKGFVVSYQLKGKKAKTKTYATAKSVTKTIMSLKKGTYTVKVRAYVTEGAKKAYSSWTKAKTVKVKK